MSVPVASCGITYASPSKIGGTGTGLLIFPSLLSSTVPAIIPIPTSQAGQRLEIVASGNLYVAGSSPTVGFAFQAGNSLVSANNINICSAANSAQLLTTANYYPFTANVLLSGDLNSGVLQAVSGSFTVGGHVVSVTLDGNVPAGSPASYPLNWSSTGAAFEVVFGITFGVSNANNAAQLTQFQAFA